MECERPKVDYASPQDTPRELRFESGPDWASLTIPPPPTWLSLGGLLLWVLSLSFQAVMLIKLLLMFNKMGLIPLLSSGAWINVFIIPAAVVAMGSIVLFLSLVDHHRHHHVPRRIDAQAGTLRYTRRGFWGMRRREYGPDEIRDVAVHPVKDIFARKDMSMLQIRVGRWRVIQARLKGRDPSFARNVESAFRTALRTQERGASPRVDSDTDITPAR